MGIRGANHGGAMAPLARRLVVFLGVLLLLGGNASASVTIHTDNLKIFINGVDVGSSFNGTTFSTAVRSSDGAAQFTFHGDLDLAGQSVTFVGSRGASLIAENNADLAFARFNLSANGATAGGAGGGAGGTRGSAGSGGDGGQGGYGIAIPGWLTSPGEGGAGGTSSSRNGGNGSSGGIGAPGLGGESGSDGAGGGSGTSGWANPGSAGSGGDASSGGMLGYEDMLGPNYIGNIGGSGGPGWDAPGAESGFVGGKGGTYNVFDPGRNGQDGMDGHDAPAATTSYGTGKDGSAGSDGTRGRNTASGIDNLAAGGGGGGGSGGAGGGAGVGGSAGGQGGGGGGEAWEGTSYGESGTDGGSGGRGGDGGSGGDGGDGGSGGGGGGAVEIVAMGRIDATGAQLGAAGGNGGTGTNGDNGASGQPGQAGSPAIDKNDGGGTGGTGGSGGLGASGGDGGDGGTGGGGAGGTIKLAGSVVITEVGTSTDVGGGTGSQAGDDGRVVFATNTTRGYGGTLDGHLETYQGLTLTGLGDVNPHIKPDLSGGVETPYIPDLQGGAAVTGLLDGLDAQAAEFQAIFDATTPRAMAALYRLDTGPTGYDDDFIGHDMLLLLNLTDQALLDPVLGYDPDALDALFTSSLFAQGSVLTSLEGYEIYATLIPEDAGLFNLGATGAEFVSGGTLADGEFLFLSRPVPVPGAIVLGSLGLSLGGWLCRRSRRRQEND